MNFGVIVQYNKMYFLASAGRFQPFKYSLSHIQISEIYKPQTTSVGSKIAEGDLDWTNVEE